MAVEIYLTQTSENLALEEDQLKWIRDSDFGYFVFYFFYFSVNGKICSLYQFSKFVNNFESLIKVIQIQSFSHYSKNFFTFIQTFKETKRTW